MVAGKCGGLPLGIVLVAGLLSKVSAPLNDWEKFAVNVSLTLETNDDHLFKILSLSYNNLPHHLRACFLYMGGFPEDSEIPIFKLTMLWTAEDFLKPTRSKSSEEVGEEHVVDLVKRNLISVTKRSSNGRIRLCRIHDLLRDFCIWKARDENFLHVGNNANNASQEGTQNKCRRRLCYFVDRSIPTKTSDSFVRTLLFSNNNQQYLTSLAISSTLLRVLDGSKVILTLVPAEVTELFHLRYLAFSHEYSVQFVVPPRISKLRNLQTLIIGDQLDTVSKPRVNLPPEIWKMPKLRHLIINNCCFFSPAPFPTNVAKKDFVLNSLQTLSKVANFSFAKETIEMIPNLKKLGLVYDDKGAKHGIKWSGYHLNNLLHLHQLESLTISCDMRSNPIDKNFALPLKLKKLSLSECRLSWRNLSMIGQLPNLEVLKLDYIEFEKKEWRLTEGEFVRLKFLSMRRLDVTSWRVEYTHFPNLENLIFKYCWYLKEIASEIGEIPTLQSIKVIGGLKSARDSAVWIQEEQRSFGNESLQVHVQDG